MRMEIEVELRDAPGQLSHVLDQLSRVGANVISVIHLREEARGDRVPVRIIFEILEEDALTVIQALKFKVRITKMERETLAKRSSFILIGHVFQRNIAEVTDAVFAARAEVLDVRAKLSGRERPSQVYFEITSDEDATLGAAMQAVAGIAKAKDFTMITALGGL